MADMRILAPGGDVGGSSRETGKVRRPTIAANPSGDLRFRARIDALLNAEALRARDLEAALRADYPAAVVRPRALAGERLEIWYVYRDGHWVRGGSDPTG